MKEATITWRNDNNEEERGQGYIYAPDYQTAWEPLGSMVEMLRNYVSNLI